MKSIYIVLILVVSNLQKDTFTSYKSRKLLIKLQHECRKGSSFRKNTEKRVENVVLMSNNMTVYNVSVCTPHTNKDFFFFYYYLQLQKRN